MTTPENINNQPQTGDQSGLNEQGLFPLIEGRSKAELTRLARGLGRTTSTGARGTSGTIISVEGQAVDQMMERNRLRNERGEQNG